MERTIAVACFAVSTGEFGPGADELVARLGRNVPRYSRLKSGNCVEPTYLFLVDQLVNMEGICAGLDFDCVRLFEGYVQQSEYNAHYSLEGLGRDDRLIRLKKDEVKRWMRWDARWRCAWRWPWR